MTNIILLSGWKGSGKDYVADIIVETYNYKKIGFADIVKDHVSKKYKIKRRLLDTQEGKMKMYNNIKSHRDLLIDYAEAKRKECVYYWAKIANERINKYNENIVISDWRFIEEYRYLCNNSEYNITTIRINRFETNNSSCLTEKSLDDYDFDYIIDNKDTNKIKLTIEIENVFKKLKSQNQNT
jgi:hypothetical protein